MTAGYFFVVEGADGAGTTSQTARLTHLFSLLYGSEDRVLSTREPSDGSIGKLIRKMLKTDEKPRPWREMAYLFMADRVHHIRTEILPALEEGKIVICDRYYPSTLVYQSSSAPDDATAMARMQYLYREMNGYFMQALPPDGWLEPYMCFYLSVPSPDILRERRADREQQEMYEADQTQKRVIELYEYWSTQHPEPLVKVNATASKDAVCQQCWYWMCEMLDVPRTRAEAIYHKADFSQV